MAIVFLSLGSSLGDKKKSIDLAVKELKMLGNINKISSYHETLPQGGIAKNMFLNICVELHTDILPQNLILEIMKIEDKLGRKRVKKWEDRIIDIDIISYDNLELNLKDIITPHPYAYERDFVLKPLSELTKFKVKDKKIIISQ